MRRAFVSVAVVCSVLLTALPAHAVTQVTIVDKSFTPSALKVAQGTSVTWHYDVSGALQHTSTQNAPLDLWNTGTLNPGDTSAPVVVQAAGTYPYHCSFHPSMTGKITVPMLFSSTTGTIGTPITITLAAASQAGYTFDVRKKFGTNDWKLWKTGVTSLTVTFKPAKTGTFRFRSRLHKTANGATSGWSPFKQVTVS